MSNRQISRLMITFMALCAIGVLLQPRTADAVCIPRDLESLSGDVTIRTQILVVPDASTPYAIVRCSVSGPRSASYVVPLTAPQAGVLQMDVEESWAALWTATSPYAIERFAPSVGDEERPSHDLNPTVIERVDHTATALLDGRVTVMEVDLPVDAFPEMTAGVLHIGLADTAMAGTEEAWLPAFWLPLATLEDGSAALPVIPVGHRAGPTANVTFETTAMLLAANRYFAFRGFDLWEAIERPPGGIVTSAAIAAPDPVLAIPVLLRTHNVHRRDFATHYADRIAAVVGDLESAVALLQYAGPIGQQGQALPQPPALASHTSGNRVVRLRLDRAAGLPIAVVEIAPMFFQSLWVSLPDAPEVVLAPPDELELSDESLIFTFGAELPAELTADLIRGALEENMEVISDCDPGTPTPVYADVQIAVEPGGTTLAAFVGVDDAVVGQCLVDGFAHMLFPLATGPPIAIRFPVQYGSQ